MLAFSKEIAYKIKKFTQLCTNLNQHGSHDCVFFQVCPLSLTRHNYTIQEISAPVQYWAVVALHWVKCSLMLSFAGLVGPIHEHPPYCAASDTI